MHGGKVGHTKQLNCQDEKSRAEWGNVPATASGTNSENRDGRDHERSSYQAQP